MKRFFTLAMGFMVITALGCGEDKKVEPQFKQARPANAVEIKKAEAKRFEAQARKAEAQARKAEAEAKRDRERRMLMEKYDFDKGASAKPAMKKKKGHSAQTIAHTKGGGTVQITVPKGWQTAPKRFKRCTMLRSEQKTLVCRVDGTPKFYDACILKPRRSRTVYVGGVVGGVRILGDEEEYTREEIAKLGEELLGLLPRATGNINISCWSIPLKRVLRGRSYYASKRRTHRRRNNGNPASKSWVKEKFATKRDLRKVEKESKAADRRERRERKAADRDLRAMYHKVRRAVQPGNTPQS